VAGIAAEIAPFAVVHTIQLGQGQGR